MNNSDLEYFNYILNNNNNINNRENNTCLISNKELTDNYITLNCGHKFNYLELYNECFIQKTNKILDNKLLKINEIKCPYCRNKSNFLLPYFKYYNVKDVKGLTFPREYCLKTNECEFINKNGSKCTEFGCQTKMGVYCNKHCKLNFFEENNLKNISYEKFEKLNKINVKTLKIILKNNNLKMVGNKKDLINRILLNKINIDNY